jgi:hypothetical protein
MRPIVGRVDNNRIVGDAKIVERLQQFYDMPELDIPSGPGGQARLVAMFCANMSGQMHAGGVEPAEEGHFGCDLPLDEVGRRIRGIVVDRLHALLGQ